MVPGNIGFFTDAMGDQSCKMLGGFPGPNPGKHLASTLF